MNIVTDMPYKKHVLVCCNERAAGDCCSNVGGESVFKALKEWVAAQGLVNDVWVTRTRCLGFCNPVGTTVVVYPEGKWFLEVTEKDIGKVTATLLDTPE